MQRTQRPEREKEDDPIVYAEKCFERGFRHTLTKKGLGKRAVQFLGLILGSPLAYYYGQSLSENKLWMFMCNQTQFRGPYKHNMVSSRDISLQM